MPRLALSMIVRDAAADLERCLASARSVADEIVVADTGSRDDTIAVARAHGARVISIAWSNDFAAARNAALEPVTADWVLSLDADERLDREARKELPRLLANREIAAYQVNIRNYFRDDRIHMYDQLARANDGRLAEARDCAAFVVHQNLRLFRRQSWIRFEGRVHENVSRSVLAHGGAIGPPSLLIHHLGLADPEAMRRKAQAYRELGKQKVREMPNDAQAHLELGAEELEHFGEPAAALALFERACLLAPRMALAWYYLGLARIRVHQLRAAVEALTTAERLGISGPLLYDARGDASYDLGEFSAAARDYRRALKLVGESALIESKLGLTEIRAGEPDAGFARMKRAVRREPDNATVRDRMIAAAAAGHRFALAAEAAEDYLRVIPNPSERAYLRAASIRAQLRQWAEAEAVLRDGLSRWPASPALCEALREVETGAAAPAPENKNQPLPPVPNSPPLA